MTAQAAAAIALSEAEQFVYREARLADDHDFDGWEALWTDDGVYWVPAGGPSRPDPETQMSIVFDNRSRIGTRVRQLKSGKRHSQNPRSSVRRLVANVELLAQPAPSQVGRSLPPGRTVGPPLGVLGDCHGDALVGANFLAVESRDRGTTLWAGRAEYRLRRVDGALRMAAKTVLLVDRDRPVPTLSFLI